MNPKKIIGFLLLRPFFTSRNLTSLALVAFFIGVYVLCGGKITAVPTSEITSFGGLSGAAVDGKAIDDSLAEQEAESKETVAQNPAEKKRGLFGNLTEDTPSPRKDATPTTRRSPTSLDDDDSASELVDMKKRLEQLGTSEK